MNLQKFTESLCTLMIQVLYPYILKDTLFQNPNFEKILVENTSIIAHKINKPWLQIQEA